MNTVALPLPSETASSAIGPLCIEAAALASAGVWAASRTRCVSTSRAILHGIQACRAHKLVAPELAHSGVCDLLVKQIESHIFGTCGITRLLHLYRHRVVWHEELAQRRRVAVEEALLQPLAE